MRGSSRLYHRPYIPLNRPEWCKQPYICRLAPSENGFELEWLKVNDGKHVLYYSKRGLDDYQKLVLTDDVAMIEGLDSDTDYELYIEDEVGIKSNIRFLRTGSIPEGKTVINYLHPDDEQYAFSGNYLCSPSLVRARDDSLIAGMDVYKCGGAQNLTILFKSADDGKTWRYLTDLYQFYWGSLFSHKGDIYMIGLTTEYGNLIITKSTDCGETWTPSVTLFQGSNELCITNGGLHRAPMQIVNHNGRLWTTCEYGSWRSGSHMPGVISIDENDDLLVPENWSCTGFLHYEGEWAAEGGKQGDTMEGNVVIEPDGSMHNYLRWKIGEYLKLKITETDPEKMLEYEGIFKAPVTSSMYRLLSYKGKYILVTNRKTEAAAKITPNHTSYRNVLSLFVSEDLKNFRLIKDIVNFENYDANNIGFQYPVVVLEDDKILISIRSAFNNAHNYHDANYALFCTIDAAEIQ